MASRVYSEQEHVNPIGLISYPQPSAHRRAHQQGLGGSVQLSSKKASVLVPDDTNPGRPVTHRGRAEENKSQGERGGVPRGISGGQGKGSDRLAEEIDLTP
jgi:hypothetical protein